MTNKTQLKEFQKRMPDDIIIIDETLFDFTDDEYLSILSWLKYFNSHYKEHGKNKDTNVAFPIISKRVRLDFGLYRFPCDVAPLNGKHIVYISKNGVRSDGTLDGKQSVKSMINIWRL